MKKVIMFALLAVCSAAMAKDGILPVEIKSNISAVDFNGQPTERSGTCLANPKTDDGRFAAMLQKVTGGDKSAHVVFFDLATRCSADRWAASLAQKLGYSKADQRDSKPFVCEKISLCHAKYMVAEAKKFFLKFNLSEKVEADRYIYLGGMLEHKMIDADMQNPVATYEW